MIKFRLKSSKIQKFYGLIAIGLIGLLLLAQQPDLLSVKQALAGWTSTNLTTATFDSQGIAQVANANVNEVSAYDAAKDPPSHDQIETGVDPNWRNGLTKTTGPLELAGQQTHTSHNSLLGSTAVNDTFIYDRTKDSDPEVQAKLGIDPNWPNGVSRKSYALDFDSTDDSVLITDSSSIQNIFDSGGTISAWIKPSSDGETDAGRVFNKYGTVGWRLFTLEDSGSAMKLRFDNTFDSNDGEWKTTSTVLTRDQWYFVSVTYNNSDVNNDPIIYVNGTSVAITEITAPTGTRDSDVGENLYIGNRSNGDVTFDGIIDDVLISDSILSTNEVSAAYNTRRYLPDANTKLLLHLDEGADNSCRGGANDLCDASANGNDGASSGGPTWVSGGQAIMDASARPTITGTVADDASYEIKAAHHYGLEFDGNDEQVTVGDIGNGAKTVEFWAKASSTTQKLIDLNGSAYISVTAGVIAATGFTGETIFVDGVASTTLPDTNWHHIAVVTDTGLNASAVDIGEIAATFYSGQLDEIRISSVNRYSSYFTPIRHLSDDSSTMLLLHLDEGTGTTTVYDDNESGRTAHDGTMNGTMTAADWINLGATIPDSSKVGAALYRWRESGGTWSETRVTSTTAKEFKEAGTAEGVSVAWPAEDLRFAPEDHFSVHSWFIEAASAGVRSSTQAFPEKTAIYATDAGIDIIDLSDNTLWLRFIEGTDGSGGEVIKYAGASTGIQALNGQLLQAWTVRYQKITFYDDGLNTESTGATWHSYNFNGLAKRNGTGAYATEASDGYLTGGDQINGAFSTVINTATGWEMINAVADANRFNVYNNATGNTVRYYYSDNTNDDYSDIIITGGGEVYANNETTGALEVWNNVQADSADEANGTPDRTYDEASSPAIAQAAPTINDLSVTEGTSSALAGQNTVYLATNTDVVKIDEHTTQANSTVQHFEREGSLGSSNWSQAAFKGSLRLGGTDEYLTAADSVSLSVTADLTLEAWVNFEAVGVERTIISKWDITTGLEKKSYKLSVTASNQLAMDISGATDGAKTQDTGSLTATDTWYHVAGVYNATGQTITLYVNGAAVASTATGTIPAAITDSDQALMLGAHTGTAAITGFLNGRVDEVRITNAQSYTANFTVPSLPFNPTTPYASKALWHLDETTGVSAADSSGNSNTGTLTAGAQFTRPVLAGSADTWTGVSASLTSSQGASSPSLTSSSLFAASDGASADDGAITKVSLTDNLRQDSWTESTTPALVDADLNAVAISPRFGDPSFIYATDEGSGSFSYSAAGGSASLPSSSSSPSLHPNSAVDSDKAYETEISSSGKPGSTSPPPTYKWREAGGTWSADVEVPSEQAKFGNALRFDGTNDYVDTPSSSKLNITGTSITVEAWVNLPSVSGRDVIVSNTRDSGGSYGGYMLTFYDGLLKFILWDGASANDARTAALSATLANSWHHIAAVYNGTNVYIFIDGVSSCVTNCSYSNSISTSAYSTKIGAMGYDGSSWPYVGLLDEVRISNSVLYTSNFTPPTHPAEPTSSTIGLWHLDGSTQSTDYGAYGVDSTNNNDHFEAETNWQTAVDSSKYHNNGTLGASASVGTDDPTWSIGYQRLPAGGKFGDDLDFDGTDDYTLIADNNSLDITSAITLEAWVYFDTVSVNYQTIIGKRDASVGEANYVLRTGTDAGADEIEFYFYANSSWQQFITTAANLTTSTWYHIAATYDGTNVVIYKDGTSEAGTCITGTCNVALVADNNSLGIGRPGDYASERLNGRIDEVRISNTIIYSANFTAPATPFVPSNSTVGLWHFDEGAGQYAYDSSSNNNDSTLGASASVGSDDPRWLATGPNISLAWNGQTYYEDGDIYQIASWAIEQPATGSVTFASASSQYISVGNYNNITTGDFTLEAWVKPTDLDAGNDTIIDKINAAVGTNPGYTLREDTSGKITAAIEDADGDTYAISTDAAVLTAGIWTHVAAVFDRDSAGNTAIYVNGVKVAQTATGTYSSTTSSLTNAVNLRFGAGDSAGSPQEFWNGELDEVRVSSVARYPLNLIPPLDLIQDSATLGLYKLNDGSGANALDSSNNANNGTLTASPTFVTNGTRGVKRIFPLKSYSVVSEGGVDIIDATDNNLGIGNDIDITSYPEWRTNKLWMRINEGANYFLPTGTPDTGQSLNSQTYIGSELGLYQIDWPRDLVYFYDATDRSTSDKNIANRHTTNTYNTNNTAGLAIASIDTRDISTSVMRHSASPTTVGGRRSAEQIIAIATASVAGAGVSVINADDATYDYSNNTDDQYGSVWLTSDGDLFAANTDATNKGLEMWNNIHQDAADEANGSPDLALLTTSTPSIPSNTISDIAVLEYQSARDFGRAHRVFVATDAGAARLDLSPQSSLLSSSTTLTTRGAGAWNSKNYGLAGRFDGANNYLLNSTADFRSADSSGSITAWVNPATVGAVTETIFDSGDEASSTRQLTFAINTGLIQISQRNNDTNTRIVGDTAMAANTWYHVAVVSDGAAYYMYVNGVLQNLTVAAGANNGDWLADTLARDNFTIGARKIDAVANYFSGYIDDLRLFNTALTQAQVQALADTDPPPINSSTVGYWPFGAKFKAKGQQYLDSETTVYDQAGNGYNGTWTGAAVGYQAVLPSLAGSSAAATSLSLTPFDFSSLNFPSSPLTPRGQQQVALATNGAGADDGAVTMINASGSQEFAFESTDTLADLDVSSVAMLSDGDIFVGTDATSVTRLRNKALDTSSATTKAQRTMRYGKSVIDGVKTRLNK